MKKKIVRKTNVRQAKARLYDMNHELNWLGSLARPPYDEAEIAEAKNTAINIMNQLSAPSPALAQELGTKEASRRAGRRRALVVIMMAQATIMGTKGALENPGNETRPAQSKPDEQKETV